MGSLFNGFCLFGCWLPYILNPPTQTVPGSEPDIAYKTYDYIVVGGGLTGLTVANRLSEDSSRTLIKVTAAHRADQRQARFWSSRMATSVMTSLLRSHHMQTA